MLDSGMLEYVTVYSREPGSNLVNVATVSSSFTQLSVFLQTNLSSSRAEEIRGNLGVSSSGPARATGSSGAANRTGGTATASGAGGATANRAPAAAATVSFTSPLKFYQQSKMTATEFALVGTNLTTTSGTYVNGQIG